MPEFVPASPDELRARYLRVLRSRLPQIRSAPGDLAYEEASAVASVVGEVVVLGEVVARRATPLDTDEQGLASFAELLGVPRKGATGALRAQALQATGEPGTSISVGLQLTHSSGLVYQNTSGGTLPASGTLALDVAAIDTGASTRLDAGTVLRWSSPPAGLATVARLVLALTEGGEDEEPVALWRQRVQLAFARPGQGGNETDYKQWVLANDGVAEAYIYRHKPGLLHVGVVGYHAATGTARLLTAGENATVLAYIEARRPVAFVTAMLDIITTSVHGDVRIAVYPGFEYDWDDGAGFLVDTYDPDTRTLTAQTDFPATLSAGHLLSVASATPSATGADGRPAMVAARVAADAVVLAPLDVGAPLNFTPASGDAIYASSATARATRDAILDGFSLENGRRIPGLHNLGPANPGGVYGAWLSDVRIDNVRAAALSVEGVLDVTVAGGDTEATEYPAPDTTTVEQLLPGQWVVRKA